METSWKLSIFFLPSALAFLLFCCGWSAHTKTLTRLTRLTRSNFIIFHIIRLKKWNLLIGNIYFYKNQSSESSESFSESLKHSLDSLDFFVKIVTSEIEIIKLLCLRTHFTGLTGTWKKSGKIWNWFGSNIFYYEGCEMTLKSFYEQKCNFKK